MSNHYTKHNVEFHEYYMHKYVYDLHIVNVPAIISYDRLNKILIMEKINNMNISDMYGEKACNINEELFGKIRSIIKTLYNYNIGYPDITGYNFIEYDGKVWIIDFEHSYKIDPFITKFIKGANIWNPEYE